MYSPSGALPTIAPPSGASRPRLTFIGTGYLGATYAICFAELGYEVLGVDVDADKIAKLSAGEVPFHEAWAGRPAARQPRGGPATLRDLLRAGRAVR
jgi:Predicted UDP-glucose 6-dehydrogenase